MLNSSKALHLLINCEEESAGSDPFSWNISHVEYEFSFYTKLPPEDICVPCVSKLVGKHSSNSRGIQAGDELKGS